MVNLPNWLPLRFRLRRPTDAGPVAHPGHRARCSTTASPGPARRHAGAHAAVRGRATAGAWRCASSASSTWRDPHLAALRTEFTAEGWSGEIEVEAALDGAVTNTGVARYRAAGRPPSDPRAHRDRGPGHGVAALPHQHLRHPDRPGRPHRRRRQPPAASTHPPRAAARRPPPGCSRSPGPARHRRQDGRPAHLPRPGDQRPAARRRRPGGRGPGLRRPARLAPSRPGQQLWRRAELDVPGRGGPHPAAAPLPRAADPLPAHRRPRRRASRPGGCTARRTAGMSSGTSCSSCPT